MTPARVPMSHVPKNKQACWRPSAPLANLQQRAAILKKIRDFFHERGVLEVETPQLCHTSVTDPFIASIPVMVEQPSRQTQHYYLQTSPEYAMKRLLAAGSGAIYQIAKVFRQGEVGRYHNPEFTMLEWYRPGFDHHALMTEMDALLQVTLKLPAAERISYASLFSLHLNIDVHHASHAALQDCARAQGLVLGSDIDDRDTWLQLLMAHCIEPHLGHERPCFIYDFPASQAALAKIQATTPPVASRFEVYIKGIELANGFHELQDANEQRRRFEANCVQRKTLGLATLPIDEYFLSALTHGLPDCAGVALGIDRLLMIATESNAIADVISFDFPRV